MQMLKHKVMKQVILISSILFLLPFTLLSQDISKKTISEIEELAKKYAELNDIPTINVGIVIGKNTYFINNGVKNRKTGIETSENSIFQIASVGKLLTGIVINDLIIKGKLNKNEPITSYLPETYSKRVNNKLKNITVRDLLHHQSGLPRQSKVINRKNDEPIIYNYTQTDFEKDFEKMKIKSSGTFSYSNFGFAVLGYIAEKVTDSTFEDLLKNLSTEYDLEFTSIECKDRSSLVTPYNEDNRNMETKNWELGKLAPPSGLYSSVSDLTKLLLSQLEVYAENNEKDKLFLTSDTRDAWNGTGISYGYGMFDWGNGGFGHGGGMDGYGSEYWLNPKENVAFVLLTSSTCGLPHLSAGYASYTKRCASV
jgi:CubicO group peptidase (beta-lactamase class C family)